LSASCWNLAEQIEQQEREVRLCAIAIALYTSFRLYFQKYQFTVYVEPTARAGIEARQMVPDLLARTIAGWSAFEHKDSLPKAQSKITVELEEIAKKYGQTMAFDKSTFHSQVVLLCPRRLADDFGPAGER